MFRLNLFKAKLVEKGVSTRDMAGIIGCNEATLYRKRYFFRLNLRIRKFRRYD